MLSFILKMIAWIKLEKDVRIGIHTRSQVSPWNCDLRDFKIRIIRDPDIGDSRVIAIIRTFASSLPEFPILKVIKSIWLAAKRAPPPSIIRIPHARQLWSIRNRVWPKLNSYLTTCYGLYVYTRTETIIRSKFK